MKLSFESSCSRDYLQCTTGFKFFWLRLEAEISEAFSQCFFNIFSLFVHLNCELCPSAHIFPSLSGRLCLLVSWHLLGWWWWKSVLYCFNTTFHFRQALYFLGLRDGLSQWSCLFSPWQPNPILHLWSGTTRAPTHAHSSMVVSGQSCALHGNSRFPKRELQEAQRNTSVAPDHYLCTFCWESRSWKLAKVEGQENCTFSLSGRGSKAYAATFNFTHIFKHVRLYRFRKVKATRMSYCLFLSW